MTLAITSILVIAPKSASRMILKTEEEKAYLFLYATPADVPLMAETIALDLLLIDKHTHCESCQVCATAELSNVPIILCHSPLSLSSLTTMIEALTKEGRV